MGGFGGDALLVAGLGAARERGLGERREERGEQERGDRRQESGRGGERGQEVGWENVLLRVSDLRADPTYGALREIEDRR